MKAQEPTPLSGVPPRKVARSVSTHRRALGTRHAAARWIPSAVPLLLMLLGTAADCAPAKNREPSVGIEGTVERVLNSPDYTPLPVTENTPLILRVHSVKRNAEGKYNYTFAYIGLQSGVFNLADYLQNSAGKRVRDALPVISVTVQALLPDNASATLPNLPTAPAPRSIPYRPAMFLLILGWLGCGASLFYQRPKKTAAPVVPATQPKTFGEILQPLALKAARKTISSEEKMQLEQTIIRYWSERLHVEELDAEEKRAAILENAEGGLLLRSIERWLYQPYSLVLSSEVTKVLAPYFKVPAPLSDPSGDEENGDENEDEDAEDDQEDGENRETGELADEPRDLDADAEDDDQEAENEGEPEHAVQNAAEAKPKTARIEPRQQRRAARSDNKATP